MPPNHYYLTAESTLGELPPRDWKAARVSIIVALSYAKAQSLHTRAWSDAECRATVQAIRAAAYRADLYLGVSCTDERGVSTPTLATFSGYDTTGPFLGTLARLAPILKASGFSGLAVDAECYVGTPGNSGGIMVRRCAWPAAPRVAEHASRFRAALAGLPLLVYVYLADAARFPAFRQWCSVAGPLAYLDEGGYLNAKPHASPWQGKPVIQGLALTRRVARELPTRKTSRFLWSPEPPGRIWT